MKKLAMLLIAALLLCLPWASADVAKGDRNEEVRYLQWLLLKTGWLPEKPDGVFGNHTEQAVMASQEALGLEQTGVADVALMQALDKERVRQGKLEHGQDYYESYDGTYVPPYDTNATTPLHCTTTALPALICLESCEDHLPLLEREYALTLAGGADGYAEAAALWREDIDALFDAWSKSALWPNRREAIEAVREAWFAWFDAQRDMLNALTDDPAIVERQLMLSLKYFAGALCGIRSGDASLAAPSGLLNAEGSAEAGAACECLPIYRGTEFITACGAHAPLLARECALSGEDGGLSELADGWSAELSALYGRLSALCPDAAGIDDAFQTALTGLDAAIQDETARSLAGLRIQQLECARLCELLSLIG